MAESVIKKMSGIFGSKEKREQMEKIVNRARKDLMPDIQVMMLGARRVGKTSILASMISQFEKVTTDTNLVITKEKGKAIDEAYDTIKGYFTGEHKPYDIVTLDNNGTPGFDYFDIKLSIANKKNFTPRKIRFMDCSGEWITNYTNEEEISKEIDKSDVIIIAIDSVLLMEEGGKYNGQNAVQNITNFIEDRVKPGEGMNDHKMVLFVPLKCEKYYWQSKDKLGRFYGKRMNDLNQEVKRAYADLFAFLKKPNNAAHFDVAILPILTIGGIEFYEFTADKNKTKVSTDEMKYVYCRNPQLEPQHCEQPLIYTLLYEYNKIQKDYVEKAYDRAGKKKFGALIWEWLQDKRKMAKDQDYVNEMKKLESKIKHEGDGFEIIQGVSIR